MDVTATQQLQSFSFPLLKHSEILQCMADLGIALSEAELSEPHRHRDVVREVFIRLIETGMGINEIDLFTPTMAMMEHRATFTYPELHEESLGEVVFLKSCFKLMMACGVSDFSVRDLQMPTSRRLRRQLSGAINLFKFREDKLQIYAELLEQRNKILANLEHVKSESSMLNEQLEKAKVDSANEWNAIEEVENDCAEIETEITQQNKLQGSIRQENAELKKKANELSDQIATASLALQEAQTEEQKLSSRVVQSPDRIRKALTAATKSVDLEKKECAAVQKEVKTAQQSIENVGKAKADVLATVTIIESILEEKIKCNEVEKLLSDTSSRVDACLSKLEELKGRVNGVNGDIQLIEEKSSNMRKQGNVKMEAAQKSLEAAQRDLILVEKERQEGMARIDSGEAEVKAIEQNIKSDKEKMEKEISDIICRYKEVEESILEHDAKLMHSIGCL